VQASACCNQSFRITMKEFLIHPGVIVETLKIACRGELQEIFISLHVFDENDKMARRFINTGRRFVKPALRGNIQLAADNGFDPRFLGLLIKFDGAEEIAMIGHGDGGHLIFFSLFK